MNEVSKPLDYVERLLYTIIKRIWGHYISYSFYDLISKIVLSKLHLVPIQNGSLFLWRWQNYLIWIINFLSHIDWAHELDKLLWDKQGHHIEETHIVKGHIRELWTKRQRSNVSRVREFKVWLWYWSLICVDSKSL